MTHRNWRLKLGPAALLVVTALALANPARAGFYHSGSNLDCSVCHVMHYSMQHDYSGGAPGTLGALGPYDYLLKDSRSNICLLCHDGDVSGGDSPPDVIGAAGAGQPTYRLAGALTTGSAPYADTNGHTPGSTATAPGGTWSASTGLACPDCHNAHGTSNYRNLVLRPGGVGADVTVTVNSGAKNNAFDVTETALTPTSTQYGIAAGVPNALLNEPSTTASAMGKWCGSCHTNFYGAGGSAATGGQTGGHTTTPWIRHPQCDVNIGANTSRHTDSGNWSTLTGRVRVMSADATYGNTDDTPTCLSCHKAHGSTHKFGLIWDSGSTSTPEDGTAIKDTCQQCHNQ